jgi:hypothetical protein
MSVASWPPAFPLQTVVCSSGAATWSPCSSPMQHPWGRIPSYLGTPRLSSD